MATTTNMEYYNKLKSALIEMQNNYINHNDIMLLETLKKYHIARNGLSAIKEIDFTKDYLTDEIITKVYERMYPYTPQYRAEHGLPVGRHTKKETIKRMDAMRTKNVQAKAETDVINLCTRGDGTTPLSNFHTSELFAEIRKRGWTGELTKRCTMKI